MQRTDENIYIDDTLVTCAEYQLFIDEMREQGKHYQPDHWISYEFPKGQASKPIVGVRYSDMEAFCDWLTHHEDGAWRYRQPNRSEAVRYPIRSTSELPIGYWIKSEDYGFGFEWISPLQNRSHISFLNYPLDLDHAHDLAVTLAGIFEYVPNREPNDVYDGSHARIINLARALDRDLSLASYRNLDLTLANALDVAIALIKIPRFDVSLYSDLFTLEARIAGQFPAFEGIRLVKERIR